MKFFLNYAAVAVLSSLGLATCSGSSSGGVIGPQGDAYVVHQSNLNGDYRHLLYKTDGTNTGTGLLHTPSPQNFNFRANIDNITTFGNFVYFSQSIKDDSSSASVPTRSFYQLDTPTGVVVQQPFLTNNQMFGEIRFLTVNNNLLAYRTSLGSGTPTPMALELVGYTQAGVSSDLTSLFASYDMFFGEAVAIGDKVFFLSKAGFVMLDTSNGTVSEVALPPPNRSALLGQEGGLLFITGQDTSNNSGKLYSFDPSNSTAVPIEVSSTFLSNLDGEQIPSAGGYLFGSDGSNLIAHKASTGVETPLLPCINIKMLRGSTDKAHIACAQTSSGYIDIAYIGLTGTPSAQMVTSSQDGKLMDRARDYGILDDKLYYNGHETSGHKVWVWDLVNETTVPLIDNGDSFQNAVGFTVHNGNLIFSAQKQPQPSTDELFKFDPVNQNLVTLQ